MQNVPIKTHRGGKWTYPHRAFQEKRRFGENIEKDKEELKLDVFQDFGGTVRCSLICALFVKAWCWEAQIMNSPAVVGAEREVC